MQITVTGRHCEVDARTRDEAIEKLSKVRRLFDRFIDMDVVISEEHNPRIPGRVHCEVTLRAKGKHLRAVGTGPDASSAIDQAEAKLLRQVRKLKTRLVTKPRQAAHAGPTAGG